MPGGYAEKVRGIDFRIINSTSNQNLCDIEGDVARVRDDAVAGFDAPWGWVLLYVLLTATSNSNCRTCTPILIHVHDASDQTFDSGSCSRTIAARNHFFFTSISSVESCDSRANCDFNLLRFAKVRIADRFAMNHSEIECLIWFGGLNWTCSEDRYEYFGRYLKQRSWYWNNTDIEKRRLEIS